MTVLRLARIMPVTCRAGRNHGHAEFPRGNSGTQTSDEKGKVVKALIVIIVVVLIAALLGWISFSGGDGSASVTVDTQKVQDDTKDAVNKGREIVNDGVDAVKDAVDSDEIDDDEIHSDDVDVEINDEPRPAVPTDNGAAGTPSEIREQQAVPN